MTGHKLRLLREFRNYSQEYIAEKLGITQNAYSRIENNQTKITTERLAKLASILNIPLLELLSDREPVIQFTEPTPVPVPVLPPPNESLKEEHWRELFENTRQLYGQVICSKDERIAYLESEIHALRKEKAQIIMLIERLTMKTVPADLP